MKTRSMAKGAMVVVASVFVLISVVSSCGQESAPPIEDVDTGWVKPDGSTPADGGSPDEPYVKKCSASSGETVTAEGKVAYTGMVPSDGEISVAITKTPPPGMPSCYFTTKAKTFPFKYKFEQLEKGSQVYVMAVLKIQSGGLPIPTKCVDYYGDLGSTPLTLTGDMKDLDITLDLYKKSECQ